MEKFLSKFKPENGQVIPLVVGIMLGIIAMIALILDGGALMSYRRTAQAAADAGALAGAQRACYGFSDAETVAITYATNNGATTVEAIGSWTPEDEVPPPYDEVPWPENQVMVIATVENTSFFARIFGVQTLTAKAKATAGCYGVRGFGVVPIGWRCWPSDETNTAFNPDYGCQIQPLSWDDIEPLVNLTEPFVNIKDSDGHGKDYKMFGTNILSVEEVDTMHIPPEQIYILFDTLKLCFEEVYDTCSYDKETDIYCCTLDGNEICAAADDLIGDILCDLDGDGKKDIQTGGDRGYLFLTDSTTDIKKWITDPPDDFTLKAHVWLSGKSGNEIDVPINIENENWAGKVVLIPVYNYICFGQPGPPTNYVNPEDNPDGLTCVEAAHANPPWPEFTGVDDFSEKNQIPYFHIIAFQPFYLSCVSKGGDCPGYRYAQTINPQLKDNVAIIEGFFLSDYDETLLDPAGYCDIELGNCRVSLSH